MTNNIRSITARLKRLESNKSTSAFQVFLGGLSNEVLWAVVTADRLALKAQIDGESDEEADEIWVQTYVEELGCTRRDAEEIMWRSEIASKMQKDDRKFRDCSDSDLIEMILDTSDLEASLAV